MKKVRKINLPGLGVRHEFTTSADDEVAVVVHHDGQREVVVYDREDPDACTTVMRLSRGDSRTLSELLGASEVAEGVAMARAPIEGLAMEWIDVEAGSSGDGTSIGDGEYRPKTGASLVAVIRDRQAIPAPGPEFVLAAGDVVVAVGTPEGLTSLGELLRS